MYAIAIAELWINARNMQYARLLFIPIIQYICLNRQPPSVCFWYIYLLMYIETKGRSDSQLIFYSENK